MARYLRDCHQTSNVLPAGKFYILTMQRPYRICAPSLATPSRNSRAVALVSTVSERMTSGVFVLNGLPTKPET